MSAAGGGHEIAIIGSGPSGFYAAEALFETLPGVHITMYERLPVPFGLVRFGVAPDHPRLKAPTQIFERIAQNPGFRFIGNTKVGRDISVDELRGFHHAIVFAYGAEGERNLDVPGEQLPGSHTATEFVGWYNGHPDYRDRQFDFSHESVAIVGQGNVAADLARMLTMPVDDLARTDIASHAIEALRKSRIRFVHIIGRRGPAQAKFTAQELRELGEIPGTGLRTRAADFHLNPESLAELQDRKNFLAAKSVELMRKWTGGTGPSQARQIILRFLESPCAILGERRVRGLVLEKNRLTGAAFAQRAEPIGERENLECGLVFRSIGYQGRSLPGLPFDTARGTVPHSFGRIQGSDGLYATGWIKRGPSGIIGTNRACAVETISTLVKDLAGAAAEPKRAVDAVLALLAGRGVQVVRYADWKRIDAHEIRRGQALGKPREKFTSVHAMLAALADQV